MALPHIEVGEPQPGKRSVMVSSRFFLFRSRRGRVLVFTAYLALLPLWFATSYPRGMIRAYFDHLHGRYVVQLDSPIKWTWEGEYAILLEQKYGVQVQWMNDAATSPWSREFIAGYNAASEWLLTQKYGPDILAKSAHQAYQEGRWRPRGSDW
jgi:hypothetical protein